MLKKNTEELQRLEQQYPGIRAQILRFEHAQLPICSHCGSANTAEVNVGTVGRTINIACATTKFALIPNGPKPGAYWCHDCKTFYDPGHAGE